MDLKKSENRRVQSKCVKQSARRLKRGRQTGCSSSLPLVEPSLAETTTAAGTALNGLVFPLVRRFGHDRQSVNARLQLVGQRLVHQTVSLKQRNAN